MKWKTLFASLLLSICVLAQESKLLSADGQKHYKAAMTLFDMASNIDDYKAVAKEFEQVLSCDPNYADTYFNLGKIYTKLGKEYGEPYFQKAKDVFATYKKLRPEEASSIDDELYAISLIEKTSTKYRAEKNKALYVGTWKGQDYTDYILKITETDGSLKIFLSSWDGATNYKTIYDNYDGECLFFRVSHSEYDEECHVYCGGWDGFRDKEDDLMEWKCDLTNGNLAITISWWTQFYLRGKHVGTASGNYSKIYTKQ